MLPKLCNPTMPCSQTTKNESILDVEAGQAVRIVRVLSMHILNKAGQVRWDGAAQTQGQTRKPLLDEVSTL